MRDITQRKEVIPHRHFSTAHRLCLQGCLEENTDGLRRNVDAELPLYAEKLSRRAKISSTRDVQTRC